MSTLVIRFSSFGDIVLAGSVTGALAPVRFLTLRRYVDLARSLPGVTEALAWEDGPDLRWSERVVDLHGSWRSLRACLAAGAPVQRVRRYDIRRRLRVAFKTSPAPRVIDRYAEAAGVPVAAAPWIQVDGPRDAMLLCPGAAHATKQWAAERFAEVGRQWQGPVVVLGGPGERHKVEAVARGCDGSAVVDAPWSAVMAAVGRARVAVAGDTGLLHLCGAAGIPVVGLYGPTTSSDGFWCHAGTPIEIELECRPCSRYGGERCPMGDHQCMGAIDVERVVTAARALAAPEQRALP